MLCNITFVKSSYVSLLSIVFASAGGHKRQWCPLSLSLSQVRTTSQKLWPHRLVFGEKGGQHLQVWFDDKMQGVVSSQGGNGRTVGIWQWWLHASLPGVLRLGAGASHRHEAEPHVSAQCGPVFCLDSLGGLSDLLHPPADCWLGEGGSSVCFRSLFLTSLLSPCSVSLTASCTTI